MTYSPCIDYLVFLHWAKLKNLEDLLAVVNCIDGADVKNDKKEKERNDLRDCLHTVSVCRKLGKERPRGYFWKDVIHFQRQVVNNLGWSDRMVVPLPRRKTVLSP